MVNIPWWRKGAAVIAGMMWTAFIASVFCVMLGLSPLDPVSGGGIVIFFILAVMLSGLAGSHGRSNLR